MMELTMIDEDVLGTIEKQLYIKNSHGVVLQQITLIDEKTMSWLCVYVMLDENLHATNEKRVCFMSMDPNFKYQIHWDWDATAPAGPKVIDLVSAHCE